MDLKIILFVLHSQSIDKMVSCLESFDDLKNGSKYGGNDNIIRKIQKINTSF